MVHYAQRGRQGDFDAVLHNPKAQEHMRRAGELADSFEPHLYEVAFTDESSAS